MSVNPPSPLPRQADILRLLQLGQKIQAIKLYREVTGSGLKESKEAVEALAREHEISAGRGGIGLGCLVVALLVVVAVLVVFFR